MLSLLTGRSGQANPSIYLNLPNQTVRFKLMGVSPLETRDPSEFIARNFARDRTSILGSLKFIANKHGESLFGYEDTNDVRDKINRTLRFSDSLSNFYGLLQRDLLAQSFSLTWYSQGFATQPERLVAAGFERLKSGCQLKLCLLRDPISNLVVLEFVLEVLAHGPRIPQDRPLLKITAQDHHAKRSR
jgi:hypothetical protein